MSQKKVKKAKKLEKKMVQQLPLRSVYMLKKDFLYQKNDATLQFTLNLGDRKELKDFLEILEKSIADVKEVMEVDVKGLVK